VEVAEKSGTSAVTAFRISSKRLLSFSASRTAAGNRFHPLKALLFSRLHITDVNFCQFLLTAQQHTGMEPGY